MINLYQKVLNKKSTTQRLMYQKELQKSKKNLVNQIQLKYFFEI